MHNKSSLVVLAHILNPISDTKCEFFKDGAMLLRLKKVKDETKYVIEAVGSQKKILSLVSKDIQLMDYTGHVIIPSFFDTHFHWVQDDVREMPKANLLDWLDNYTFPAEHKFKNKKYSKTKAQSFFQRLTSVGTLGGACYSSIHENALVDAMDNSLGEFIIGNVLMTMNSPKNLTQKASAALSLVSKLSKKYKKKYVVTPRFAIATDPVTMKKASALAKKQGCFVQSHLCETKNEIDFVTTMYKSFKGFEKIKSYTEIYQNVGMLGPRSIMGHGIHLSLDELKILAKTQTSIAHCPTSNASVKQKGLGSGLFNFKQAEKFKISWALGSDIGAGPVLSMFDVIRSFVDQNSKQNVLGATYKKALYRSTLAGAKLLKVDKTCGNLVAGKDANFLVLPKLPIESELVSGSDCVEKIMQHYVKKGARNRIRYDNLVERVFYRGSLVFSK